MKQIAAILFLIAAFTHGCTPAKKEKDPSSVTDEDSVEAVRDRVLKSFRTSEVSVQLHHWGDTCQADLVNDISRTPHYLNASNKGVAAANLGVYLSDLGYLIECRQTPDVQRYLDACFVLANEAGMKKQFSKVIQLRFAEIISKNEDLEKSRAILLKETLNTSEGEDFTRMHASALTGYYIEELFHLVRFARTHSQQGNTADEAFKNNIRTIIDQRIQLSNLLNYLDNIKLKSEAIPLYQDLLKLQTEYHSLNADLLLKENSVDAMRKDVHLQNIMEGILSLRKRIIEL